MIQLYKVVWILTIVSCVTANEHLSKILDAKYALIKRESQDAAAAILKMTVSTNQDKLQLTSMVTDLMVALNHAINLLNNVIPNIDDEREQKILSFSADELSQQVYNLQVGISTDRDNLKQTLQKTLQALNDAVILSSKELRSVTNFFASKQLQRIYAFVIYSLTKLKLQSTLLGKSNQSLGPEFASSLNNLITVLNTVSSTDKTAEHELRHILQHISTVSASNVAKLNNWVAINTNNTSGVKAAQNVEITLSQLFARQSSAASYNNGAASMKTQLQGTIEDGARECQQLVDIQYAEHSGGIEFISSILFDGITIGQAYRSIIESIIFKV